MTTLITLIGEQPIPNLLPIRALKPERVLFVHTGDGPRGTKNVAQRVAALVAPAQPVLVCVDPYAFLPTCDCLRAELSDNEEVIFNLTGGTKMMALAAYTLAVERRAPFVYFQTEGKQAQERESRLYRYGFAENRPQLESDEILPTLITIEDYLRAHLPGYVVRGFSRERGGLSDGGRFEKTVYDALEKMAKERGVDLELMAGVHPEGVKDALDIDLVVRSGNQVGVVEIKKNPRKGKEAIDQLTTIARREYLGTYTARFVVLGNEVLLDHRPLFDNSSIAVAQMLDYIDGQPLSQADCTRLWDTLAIQIPLSPVVE